MKVAVIGAGAMGSGIAQTFAQCDAVEKVYLCDIKQEFADGGLNKIKKGLDRLVSKGKMEQAAADAITGKIVTGLSDIAVDPDLVVEAALEVMDINASESSRMRSSRIPTASMRPILLPYPSHRSAQAFLSPSSACTSSIPLLL